MARLTALLMTLLTLALSQAAFAQAADTCDGSTNTANCPPSGDNGQVNIDP
ncbi:hypothetical protein [Hasllibacter sp. MH4015]|uniref:hypothetical protein n=1 Tax=Hasllibacter sp. MH4015 TaxID=2854029 RepID=UPI001CD741D2|nr:hypothetical protein [Hasllibacter sp. MH4015]